MKFGVLKSKIEKCLIESYNKNTFKDNIFIFNELVRKNKNISKLYYLYDELSSKKGLSESLANDFVNESINLYENTINKINKKHIDEINIWVNNVETKNEYSIIDDLFSNNVVTLENKIKSRKQIVESLKSVEVISESGKIVHIPLDDMIEVANKTVNEYISKINESEKKEILSIINEDENKLKIKFDFIKENTIKRLENILETESDEETKKTIQETIQKVTKEKFDKISFVKLKSLNESL
jgi:hypothetical protein